MKDILIKTLEVFIMLTILLSPLNKIFKDKDGFLQGGAIVILQALSLFLFVFIS